MVACPTGVVISLSISLEFNYEFTVVGGDGWLTPGGLRVISKTVSRLFFKACRRVAVRPRVYNNMLFLRNFNTKPIASVNS